MLRRIGLACLVAVAAASGASADTLADCSQGRNSELRLRACSEVIASPTYGSDDKAARLPQSRQTRAPTRGLRPKPLPTSARPLSFAPTTRRAMPAGAGPS